MYQKMIEELYNDFKETNMVLRGEDLNHRNYAEVLADMCSYMYMVDEAHYKYIKENILQTEEINLTTLTMMCEILFEYKDADKQEITPETFAEDYERYWVFWQGTDIGSSAKIGKKLEGISGGALKVLVDRMWKNDQCPYDAHKDEDNDSKVDNSNKFFLKARAREFFEHIVMGKMISHDAEILYLNLFALYIKVEDDYEDEIFHSLRDELSTFRKKNDSNVSVIEPIIWSLDICKEIIYEYHFDEIIKEKLQMQIPSINGIREFLDNFSYSKNIIRIMFYAELEKNFVLQGFVSPMGEYICDFIIRYLVWIKENKNIPILGDWKKPVNGNSEASSDTRLPRRILQNFFGREIKDLFIKDYFFGTFDKSMAYEDGQLNAKGKQELGRIYYNYFWVSLFAQLEDKDTSFLAIAEYSNLCRIILYKMGSINTELSDLKDENSVNQIGEIFQLFEGEIDGIINHANETIHNSEKYITYTLKLYRQYLREYHGDVLLDHALRDVFYQLIVCV